MRPWSVSCSLMLARDLHAGRDAQTHLIPLPAGVARRISTSSRPTIHVRLVIARGRTTRAVDESVALRANDCASLHRLPGRRVCRRCSHQRDFGSVGVSRSLVCLSPSCLTCQWPSLPVPRSVGMSMPLLPSPPGAWYCSRCRRSFLLLKRAVTASRPVGSWTVEPIAPSTGQWSACCHLADLLVHPRDLACRAWLNARAATLARGGGTSITTRTTKGRRGRQLRPHALRGSNSGHLRQAAVRRRRRASLLSTREVSHQREAWRRTPGT